MHILRQTILHSYWPIILPFAKSRAMPPMAREPTFDLLYLKGKQRGNRRFLVEDVWRERARTDEFAEMSLIELSGRLRNTRKASQNSAAMATHAGLPC